MSNNLLILKLITKRNFPKNSNKFAKIITNNRQKKMDLTIVRVAKYLKFSKPNLNNFRISIFARKYSTLPLIFRKRRKK